MAAVRKIFGEIFFRDKASKKIDAVNSKMNKSMSSAKGLNAAMSAIGAGIFASSVIGAVKHLTDLAGAEEQTAVNFEVMLGSGEKASAMLDQLDKFSLSTPFTPSQVRENAKLLLNFGVAADKVLPSLQMLGDVSGGNANKLGSLTLAFSQVQSQGKLMGQDLLQMINAGFNPLQVMAKKTGKSMGALKKEMSAGKITARDVADAFETATSEGGKFFDMMNKQSKTWKGLVSTFQGFKGEIFKIIGNTFLRFFKPMLAIINETFKSFVENLKNSDKELAKFQIAIIIISSAIGVGLVGALVAAAIAAWSLIAPFLFWIAIGVLIGAAIAGIILLVEDFMVFLEGGKSLFGEFWNGFLEGVEMVWEAIKSFGKFLWEILTEPFIMAWKGIKKFFSMMKMIFLVVGRFVAKWGMRLIRFIFPVDLIVDAFHDVMNFIKSIPEKILNVFRMVRNKAEVIFDDIGKFFSGGKIEKIKSGEIKTYPNFGFGLGGVPQREAGGPVSMGSSYLVGEQGPEIFTPTTSGSIINNKDSKSIINNKNSTLGDSGVKIGSLVGNITINSTSIDDASDQFESAIMTVLNRLSETVLAAELGVEIA